MTWREFWLGARQRPDETLAQFCRRISSRGGIVQPLARAVADLADQVEALERRVADLEARER